MNLQTLLENPSLPGWVVSRFDLDTIETYQGGGIEDPDIRFPLASVTKTLTAHLCLQEPFRKMLDTPIKEVMPYFELRDQLATTSITPRDALCHFSGLAPHTSDWVDCPLSRKEYIEQRLPRLPSEGPFREKHRYSNLLYAVLGQWLEELSGKSWEQLITDDILKPLDMTHTGHIDESWQSLSPPPYALSDSGDLEPIPPFFAKADHLIAPASEVMGSMPDLARWGQGLLALDPNDERWQAHSQINESLSYGLGWRLDTVNGNQRVWHSGQCSGYTTLLSLVPKQRIGLAVATNRSDAVELLQTVQV